MTSAPLNSPATAERIARAAASRETGALVIGGDHPGLGVARSLGQRGIPVYVMEDQHCICSYSRYVKKVVRVPDLRNEQATVEAVLATGLRYNLKDWVLFPTRDETVAAFSRHSAELSKFFRVTTPEWDTVKWAWDKKNTYDLSEQLQIPCPRTFTVASAKQLPSLYSRLPLAIKPAVKENFFYATGAKAWRANTPEELHALFDKARNQICAEEILIQEIIPGDGSTQYSYCAFYRDNTPYGVLIARRQRQHPREFGRAATYVETTVQPLIEELSERFLSYIKFYGLVEIEFKLDPRDGEYKLLDVNARTWGFHSLGAAAGVDFPYLLFADQMGVPIEPCRSRPGIGWVRWLTDFPVGLSEILRGHTRLGDYVESLRKIRIESVFSSKDPLPSLAEVALLPYLIIKKYV